MRAVIQRVNRAAVSVDGQVVGAIDRPGLLVLVGATHDDGAAQVALIARKIADLRLLEGELVGNRRRRAGAGGLPIHPLCRHSQGTPAQLEPGGRGGCS